jgi:hypothetical protein
MSSNFTNFDDNRSNSNGLNNGGRNTKSGVGSLLSIVGAISATAVSLVLVTMVGCDIGFHNPSTPAGYLGLTSDSEACTTLTASPTR